MTLIKHPKSVQPSLLTVLKRMMRFNDADAEPDPIFLTNVTWSFIKEQMLKIAEELT